MDDVSKELREGTVINERYRLITLKGTGSFGQVWRAEDTVTGEEVAFKLYIPLDEKGREMFKREYLITKKFKHQNLLSADYFDNWGSRPFLIMQYCDRGSATGLIGNIDEAGLWRFIKDVAAGLAYLHHKNVVHQDIKPDNILIDDEGSFLITDFGISKQLKATMRAQSTTMSAAGSISYMGPERFASVPQTLPASDVWSLGATVYHLACGEPPFNAMGGVLLRNGAEMPELPPRFSRRLNDVMQSCLALDPLSRPAADVLAKAEVMVNPVTPPPFIHRQDDTILDQPTDKRTSPPPLPPQQPVQQPAPPPVPPVKKHTEGFIDQIIRGFKNL